MQRLLVIGLDGFEITLAERMMAQGRMPHMKRLREKSARYRLDHGLAKYTGLAWDHFSTGKTPEALNRYSAVSLDTATYHVEQEDTYAPPVFAAFDSRCVLFDVPYCDLNRAPAARGIAAWGAHDPGAPKFCRPASLTTEMTEKFGPYPATDYIYGMLWQSEEKTRAAGVALAEAVRVRARAARWLLAERITDWDVGVVVVSEPHSAIEPMWHGVDGSHPLHHLPSGEPARRGLEAVYEECDALIGTLAAALPDAAIMVFAMHGMGANEADVPAMALLPELLYRHRFGKPYMLDLPWPAYLPDGKPSLAEDDNWHWVMEHHVPKLDSEFVLDLAGARTGRDDAIIKHAEIDYQPASRYRPFWPDMEAFALPSFYDGRIRVNLMGRERYGMVSPNRHYEVIAELKTLLDACVTETGEPAVRGYNESDRAPLERGPTESDLYVFWRGLPTGLVHPLHGKIGPLPFRRTGGHSGTHGFLYFTGQGVAAGERGTASSFDVLPTIAALAGEDVDALDINGHVIAGIAGKFPRDIAESSKTLLSAAE